MPRGTTITRKTGGAVPQPGQVYAAGSNRRPLSRTRNPPRPRPWHMAHPPGWTRSSRRSSLRWRFMHAVPATRRRSLRSSIACDRHDEEVALTPNRRAETPTAVHSVDCDGQPMHGDVHRGQAAGSRFFRFSDGCGAPWGSPKSFASPAGVSRGTARCRRCEAPLARGAVRPDAVTGELCAFCALCALGTRSEIPSPPPPVPGGTRRITTSSFRLVYWALRASEKRRQLQYRPKNAHGF